MVVQQMVEHYERLVCAYTYYGLWKRAARAQHFVVALEGMR
jgi:hypothetical protein